jgi:hypothetical protein
LAFNLKLYISYHFTVQQRLRDFQSSLKEGFKEAMMLQEIKNLSIVNQSPSFAKFFQLISTISLPAKRPRSKKTAFPTRRQNSTSFIDT